MSGACCRAGAAAGTIVGTNAGTITTAGAVVAGGAAPQCRLVVIRHLLNVSSADAITAGSTALLARHATHQWLYQSSAEQQPRLVLVVLSCVGPTVGYQPGNRRCPGARDKGLD